MNGFEQRKQQKKRDILQAAFGLFNEKGTKAVNIADIAKKASVSQVTIYNHFNSKEQLIREVVKDYSFRKFEEFAGMLRSDRPFQEKVKVFILDKLHSLESLNMDFMKAAMEEDEELKGFLEEFYQQKAAPLFMEFIQDSQQKGDISKDISIQSILFHLNMFKTAMDSLPVVTMLKQNEKLAEELLHLFFYGITGSSPSEE
ncbi:TetR/AcrR family transcriptional regulator [Priestia abyssalis]|uniref:TetR/AcrR family transcriptional regulator n=1 Tax=Priestia abyssalis TaxID=1221450 RepID=UPI0009954BD4|nr:TetR/AcrR family transcriptional regulator [Priestia abyssalis]